MSNIEITDEEYAVCKRQATRVAGKWKAAQREDIEGDLLLWLCENHHHVTRYRTEDGGRQKLGKALYRHALRRAMSEQEHHNGSRLQDDWSPYTKERVKAALPYIWDREDWPSAQATVDPRHGGLVKGSDPRSQDALCVLIDVRAAVERLNVKDQEVLRLKFRDGLGTREAASKLGVSTGVFSRRVWDAVDKTHAKLAESAYRS